MRNNWREYWNSANLIKVGDGAFRLTKRDDSLNFFVDRRKGGTYGMVFLFAAPGSKGSVLARGEEAEFLEGMLAKG